MRTLIICGLLALTGCAVGPNYKRPQLPIPDQFRGATAPAGGAASFADTKWQELFPDPALNQLVSTALEHNFDLQIAAERIEQARAQLGITRANQFPFLDVQAGVTGSRSSSVGASTFVKAGTSLSAT